DSTTNDVATTTPDDILGPIDAGPSDSGPVLDVPSRTDVPSQEDAGAADTLVADDVNVVIDTGVTDVGTPVDAGTHDTGTADAGAPDTGPIEPDTLASLCDWGEPGEPVCYNAEQLQNNIDNPPFGGKPGVDPYAGPLPPEGCPEPALVMDGCCNPGVGAPELVGTECCYVHCQGACCGRPFVVEGHTRVAALTENSLWSTPVESAPIATAAAQKLAAAWRQDAQDEHASVASFMRFGLELMHVGAPPELVAGAAAAAADEVRHAQLTLDIASSLDGQAQGPGALNCADVQPRSSWSEIVIAAIAEGCVGETLAAAQVAAAARATTNLELRETLDSIAADEGRHAELAWRFVAWSWREGSADIRRAISDAFAQAARLPVAGDARENTLAGVSDSARRRAGRLGSAEAFRVNQETMRMVVLPCADALLAESPA
ncbi:MAG: hypothetical protein ACI9OJ_004663, partial [Myxococcota bacterium]